MNLLRSDVFVLSIGKFFQLLLLFIAVKVFTTLLSDVEVGNLILILSITMFFGLALINPVGSFINRELNNWVDSKTIWRQFLKFNAYVIFISFLAFMAPMFLAVVGVGQSIDTLYFSIVVSFFVFFNTWNQTLIPSINLLFHRKAFVFFTLISVILYLFFSSLFVLFIDASAIWWLIGQMTGLALGALFSWIYLQKFLPKETHSSLFSFSLSDIKTVVRFSLPIAFATLLLWIIGNAYKLLIDYQLGAEALAYLGLALMLAFSLAGAVESLALQVFHAPFYKSITTANNIEERAQAFQRFIDDAVPIITGAVFVLMACAPYLLTILADDRFSSIVFYFSLALIFELIRIYTNLLGHAAHSEYKTLQNIGPYLLGAITVLIGLPVALTMDNWEYAVILTLFVGWLVSLLWMIRTARKILNFTFPFKQIFKIIVFLLPVFLISFLLKDNAQNSAFSLFFLGIIGGVSATILFKHYSSRNPV